MAEVTFPNGHKYTDDDHPTTGLLGGGHRFRFIPALKDFVDYLISGSGGGGSSVPVNILHADLVILANANAGAGAMTVGGKYRITNYSSRHRMRGTHSPLQYGYVTGYNDLVYNYDAVIPVGMQPATEPLIVTAISPNALDIVAYSEDFPQDIIHYSLADPTAGALYDGFIDCDRGWIVYREDTLLNVKCPYDFRNVISYFGSFAEAGTWIDTSLFMAKETVIYNRVARKTFDMDLYGTTNAEGYPLITNVEILPNSQGAINCIWFKGEVNKIWLGLATEGHTYNVDNLHHITAGTCTQVNVVCEEMQRCHFENSSNFRTIMSIEGYGYSVIRGLHLMDQAKLIATPTGSGPEIVNVAVFATENGIDLTDSLSNAQLGISATPIDITHAELVELAGGPFVQQVRATVTVGTNPDTIVIPNLNHITVNDTIQLYGINAHPVTNGNYDSEPGDYTVSAVYPDATSLGYPGFSAFTVSNNTSFWDDYFAHIQFISVTIAGSLVPGQKYRITDYRTKHKMRLANSPLYELEPSLFNTDATGDMLPEDEPLIVTAQTDSKLFLEATTTAGYPDIIRYELVDLSYRCPSQSWFADRGKITYRKDTIQHVECDYDFRNVLTQVGSSVENSGIFDVREWDLLDPPAFNIKFVKTFDMTKYGTTPEGSSDWAYGVSAVTIRPPRFGEVPSIHFDGFLQKITLDYGAEGYLFNGDFSNVAIGQCNNIVLLGGGGGIQSGQNATIHVAGMVQGLVVAPKAQLNSTSTVYNVSVLAPHVFTDVYITPLERVVLGNQGLAIIQTEASDYTLVPEEDCGKIITFSAAAVVTLPAASTFPNGFQVQIWNASTTATNVTFSGTTIPASQTLTQHKTCMLLVDSSNWRIAGGLGFAGLVPPATDGKLYGIRDGVWEELVQA